MARHFLGTARRIAAALTLATVSMAPGSPALAHAMLAHAVPSAGSTVKTSPKQVSLRFSEQLEPAFSKVAVTDTSGRDQTAAASTASGTTMQVALKPLPRGTYRVKWTAVSVDTHRTTGTFEFVVAQ